jgi:hypothetical protein
MQARKFEVTWSADDDGHWYAIDGGERRGPFPGPMEAERDFLGTFARWRARARELGGFALRATKRIVVVTLPDGVPVEGGEALHVEGRTMGPMWLSPTGRQAA